MAVWTDWDPLEEIIVGDCYSPGELDWSVAPEIKDSMNIILKETKEDLNNLAELLTSMGVIVHRPNVTTHKSSVDLQNFQINTPTAPMVPRDQYLVYGDTVYQTYTSLTDRYLDSVAYYDIFKKLFDQGSNWISAPPPRLDNQAQHHPHWGINGPEIYASLSDRLLWHTATMFKCGDTIIVNNLGPGTAAGLEWIKRNINDTKFIDNTTTHMKGWGHIDHGFFMTDDNTVFCKSKEWVPACLLDKDIHEVGIIQEDNILYNFLWPKWRALNPQLSEKISTDLIDNWLSQWKGYYQKINFDTNVLVVDSKNVIFSNDVPKRLFELMSAQGITCHVSLQRHGYLWEGGIHCFTLDIKRLGERRSIINN